MANDISTFNYDQLSDLISHQGLKNKDQANQVVQRGCELLLGFHTNLKAPPTIKTPDYIEKRWKKIHFLRQIVFTANQYKLSLPVLRKIAMQRASENEAFKEIFNQDWYENHLLTLEGMTLAFKDTILNKEAILQLQEEDKPAFLDALFNRIKTAVNIKTEQLDQAQKNFKNLFLATGLLDVDHSQSKATNLNYLFSPNLDSQLKRFENFIKLREGKSLKLVLGAENNETNEARRFKDKGWIFVGTGEQNPAGRPYFRQNISLLDRNDSSSFDDFLITLKNLAAEKFDAIIFDRSSSKFAGGWGYPFVEKLSFLIKNGGTFEHDFGFFMSHSISLDMKHKMESFNNEKFKNSLKELNPMCINSLVNPTNLTDYTIAYTLFWPYFPPRFDSEIKTELTNIKTDFFEKYVIPYTTSFLTNPSLRRKKENQPGLFKSVVIHKNYVHPENVHEEDMKYWLIATK